MNFRILCSKNLYINKNDIYHIRRYIYDHNLAFELNDNGEFSKISRRDIEKDDFDNILNFIKYISRYIKRGYIIIKIYDGNNDNFISFYAEKKKYNTEKIASILLNETSYMRMINKEIHKIKRAEGKLYALHNKIKHMHKHKNRYKKNK